MNFIAAPLTIPLTPCAPISNHWSPRAELGADRQPRKPPSRVDRGEFPLLRAFRAAASE
jgi:hypothetical protein